MIRFLLLIYFLLALSFGFSQTYKYDRAIDFGKPIQVTLFYHQDTTGTDAIVFSFLNGFELDAVFSPNSIDNYDWVVQYKGKTVARMKLKFNQRGREIIVSYKDYNFDGGNEFLAEYLDLSFGHFDYVDDL